MRHIRILAALMLCLFTLTGCACKHQWTDAACLTPKTCTLCEETEGEPAGHSWAEATCEFPKTCTACGLTGGEALGHIEGEPDYSSIDFVNTTGDCTVSCTTCGEEIFSGNREITKMHNGTEFLFSTQQFTDRIDAIIKEDDIIESECVLGYDADGKCHLALVEPWAYGAYFATDILFEKDGLFLNSDSPADAPFDSLFVVFGTSSDSLTYDSEYWLLRVDYDLQCVLEACDPSLSEPDTAQTLFSQMLAEDSASFNGITYSLFCFEDYFLLIVDVTG